MLLCVWLQFRGRAGHQRVTSRSVSCLLAILLCLLTILLLLRSSVGVRLLAGVRLRLLRTWVACLLTAALLRVRTGLPTRTRRGTVTAWLALLSRIAALLRRGRERGALRRGLRGRCPDLGVPSHLGGLTVGACMTEHVSVGTFKKSHSSRPRKLPDRKCQLHAEARSLGAYLHLHPVPLQMETEGRSEPQGQEGHQQRQSSTLVPFRDVLLLSC